MGQGRKAGAAGVWLRDTGAVNFHRRGVGLALRALWVRARLVKEPDILTTLPEPVHKSGTLQHQDTPVLSALRRRYSESEPSLGCTGVPGQPRLHSQTLSQNPKYSIQHG